MEDTAEDVKRKLKKAYCPPGVVEKNPILDYCRNIVIAYYGELTVNIHGNDGAADQVCIFYMLVT